MIEQLWGRGRCQSLLATTMTLGIVMLLVSIPSKESLSQTSVLDSANASNNRKHDSNGKQLYALHVSSLFPQKLFTVVGLESSGTTFTAVALASALGLWIDGRPTPNNGDETIVQGYSNAFSGEKTRYMTAVQHISLPWGASCTRYPGVAGQGAATVVYPTPCMMALRLRSDPDPVSDKQKESLAREINDDDTWKACRALVGESLFSPTPNDDEDDGKARSTGPLPFNYYRYILNITSHLDWYSQRGVDVRVIVVARDTTISFLARSKAHCRNATLERAEEALSMQVLNEALDLSFGIKEPSEESHRLLSSGHDWPSRYGGRKLQHVSSDGRLLIVSYELLNRFRDRYLSIILQSLGVEPLSSKLKETTTWEDGNSKYINVSDP